MPLPTFHSFRRLHPHALALGVRSGLLTSLLSILSRVSTLTRVIDKAILSVCLSARDVPGLDEKQLNIVIVVFTIREPNHSSFISVKHLNEIPTGSHPEGALNTGWV